MPFFFWGLSTFKIYVITYGVSESMRPWMLPAVCIIFLLSWVLEVQLLTHILSLKYLSKGTIKDCKEIL